MNENCKFLKDTRRSCSILKQLYCKIEPNKKCSWYQNKCANDKQEKIKDERGVKK